MRSRTLLFAFAVLLAFAAASEAKSYTADRFDSRIQVLAGGDIEVTESVTFRFDGTFREVFRRIPRRRTDGLEIRRVAMDGRAFPQGEQAGQYDLRNKDGNVVVRWHFGPVTNSTHTFELTYVARGIVQQSERGDLFAWRALPGQHDYRIASSTIAIDLPAAATGAPALRTHRVGYAQPRAQGSQVTIEAGEIRSNGWIEAELVLPAGSVISTPPLWQQRQFRARELAPTFLTTAAVVFLCGLVVLFAVRQSYDSPPAAAASLPTGPSLPDTHPPAIAGPLTANGRIGLEHAMATLFALAERGEVQIDEKPRSWGQRVFELRRSPTGAPLASYERVLLDTAFGDSGDRVDLSKARSRVTRHFSRFSGAVKAEMHTAGLLDEGRSAARNRFLKVGLGAFAAGLIAVLVAAVQIQEYGPWALAIGAAAVLIGLIAVLMYAAHTPLSNEGLRRGREWRGFRAYVREVTRDRATLPQQSATTLLPFAVALGLAHGWSSYLKKHRGAVPPWFRAAGDRGAESFAYFVYAGGSGTGHGGAGGGGAAGGGASGAH